MNSDVENPMRALARRKLSPDKFEHSIRVAWLASRLGHAYGVVGLMHDMIENSDVTEQEMREAGVTADELEAVQLLTRGPEPYEEYVATVAGSGNRLAIAVKVCDLLDHLDPLLIAGLTPEKQGRYLAALPVMLDALRAVDRQAMRTR